MESYTFFRDDLLCLDILYIHSGLIVFMFLLENYLFQMEVSCSLQRIHTF